MKLEKAKRATATDLDTSSSRTRVECVYFVDNANLDSVLCELQSRLLVARR